VRALKTQAREAQLLAVVKGNAYGHGYAPVAKAALRGGAWGAAVIGVDEGELLRARGYEGPVLVMGSSEPVLAPRVVAAGLRVIVGNREQALALAAAGKAAGSNAIVHIKVETGLNRYGLEPEEAVALAEELRALPGIVVEGLATHLASIDDGDFEYTLRQFVAYRRAADRLDWVPIKHVSSTGGLLDMPELRLNLVRTGIGVYGLYPNGQARGHVVLKPALSLRSRIARVRDIAPGESVGYSGTWRAERPGRIATVMAGYADGIKRVLSNRASMLVRGERAPVRGRVAMDMVMVDVTAIPGAAVGDEVTLIGEQNSGEIRAEELAELAETISYEILSSIMARVARIYVRGGQVVAIEDLSGYRELKESDAND
jgi:alanine racemase